MPTSPSHQVPIHRDERTLAYARGREAEMVRNGAMVACTTRLNVQKRRTVEPDEAERRAKRQKVKESQEGQRHDKRQTK